MSRTYRRDKLDKKYREGRHIEGRFYRCKCEYCRSTERTKLREKEKDKEILECGQVR